MNMAKKVTGEKTAEATPKAQESKAPVIGVMTHSKDTKRFHAVNVSVPGTNINGTIYVPKDAEFPSVLHLTFTS
jgi:hypothetical protein